MHGRNNGYGYGHGYRGSDVIHEDETQPRDAPHMRASSALMDSTRRKANKDYPEKKSRGP